MKKYGVKRDYHGKPARDVSVLALRVASAMRGNSNFPSPPITAARLAELANGFGPLPDQGGASRVAAKGVLPETVTVAALDLLADYVERAVGNDRALMMSSGFEIYDSTQTGHNPGGSVILSARSVDLGKLELELKVSEKAWAYLVEFTALPSGVTKYSMSSESNGISLRGLSPGTTYALRVMVLDEHVQKSQWSDVVEYQME